MSKIKIDVTQDVTRVLPFKPFAEFDNLCLGYLTGVEVTESKTKKEDSKWEYADYEFPKLTFIFQQHKMKEDEKTRMFFHNEMPIASIKTSGEEVTEKNLTDMHTDLWRRIKHIHDMYIGTSNYKDIKTIPEFDPEASIEERLAIFKKFFEQIQKAFNVGKDKENPIYTPFGGVGNKRDNLLAMKLVANDKRTRLEFPNYVGTGFVEKAAFDKTGLVTTLAFKADETIELGSTAVPAGSPNAVNDVSEDIAKQLLTD